MTRDVGLPVVALTLALLGIVGLVDSVLSSESDLVRRDILKRIVRGPLESRFERTEIGDPATITGVISLGGSDLRVREAGRLGRLYPHIRIVLSDDTDSLRLLGGGIEPERITLEDRSRTTWENARFTRAMVKPKQGERWLLVTSAIHMPRAMGAFRAVDFQVEPWPVHDVPARYLYYPAARHEWLGLAAYRLRGRSTALFPAP